jgi:hypothetical protein
VVEPSIARWGLTASFLAVGTACGEPPTQVLVHIDADPMAQQRATELRVVVETPEGELRLDRAAVLVGPDADIELPTTVPVSPLEPAPDRRFFLRATLLDARDEPVSHVVASVPFLEGERAEVRLRFDDACLDREPCASGQTCREGRCVEPDVMPVAVP